MTIKSDYDIAVALKEVLESSSNFMRYLSDRSKRIPINEMMNEDINRAPWAGIYFRSARIEANTLPRGFKDYKNMSVILQSQSTDPAVCFEKMGAMVKEAKQAIINNRTLRNTVDMITGDIEINYTYIETDRESLYFQMANINFTTEVRANAAS